jgi:hypothetical protein
MLTRSLVAGLCAAWATAAAAAPLTMAEFEHDLVGVPLCGTPESGPLKGKALCTVYLPDGTVVVAGAGVLVRGLWEKDGDKVCRRNADDPLERRRCVQYEKIGPDRYRNSDGVAACIGPCP